MSINLENGNSGKEALNELRIQINEVDDLILELLETRMDISKSVGNIKNKYSLKIYDKKRENEILQKLVEKIENKSHEKFIKNVYKEIFETSREIQQEFILKYNNLKIEENNNIICYQGIKGGNGHEAAIRVFGESGNLINKKYFEDVLLAIYENEAQYGILPVENSFTGVVNDVLDILVDYNASIVGEIYLPIEHCLLGIHGTKLEDVRTVISHVQALKQCSKFIRSNNLIEKAVTNTAQGAYLVSKQNDKSICAIAGKRNAHIYNLSILKENIENMDFNQTRFIIVQNNVLADKKGNKMSVRFSLPHEKSSLIKALLPIYNSDINLSSIVSRPNRNNVWQYYFYIDMIADWKNENVLRVFDEFKNNVYNIDILGIYEEGVVLEKK